MEFGQFSSAWNTNLKFERLIKIKWTFEDSFGIINESIGSLFIDLSCLARFGAGASQKNNVHKGWSYNRQMGHEAYLALMETTRMLIYNEFNNFNLINTMEENQLPFHISYLSNRPIFVHKMRYTAKSQLKSLVVCWAHWVMLGKTKNFLAHYSFSLDPTHCHLPIIPCLFIIIIVLLHDLCFKRAGT